jgi:hypothetical protein
MNILFVDLAHQQFHIRADLDRRIGQVSDHGSYIQILLKKSAVTAVVVRQHSLFRLMTGLPSHLCRVVGRLLVIFSGFRRRAGTAIHWSGGFQTSFASFLRFCAVAASMNSSWAPYGPRNRSQARFKIRFRCANSISTFLRSCLDRSAASAPARAWATSREAS